MDNKSSSLMHNFDSKSSSGLGISILLWIIVAGLGMGTGYMISKSMGSSPLSPMIPAGITGGNGSVSTGKFYGSNDTKLYKDSTEGILEKGGIEGEGQYHLVRPGGDSQNVYLISSTVDLSQFLNHKIKVWGQTQTAQKAGWLMDVGRVGVLK